MATVKLLTDEEASPEARAVFDDIRKTRNSDFVNNAWRAQANDPANLKRTKGRADGMPEAVESVQRSHSCSYARSVLAVPLGHCFPRGHCAPAVKRIKQLHCPGFAAFGDPLNKTQADHLRRHGDDPLRLRGFDRPCPTMNGQDI